MSTSDRLAGPDRCSGRPDRAVGDPARPDLTRSEPGRSEPGRSEPARSDRSPAGRLLPDGTVPAGAATLVVPAVSESLRLVRLLASGVASGAGLDIESVEDVRIAVDELANAAVAVAVSGAVLSLRFTVGDELLVEGSVACRADASAALEPLAHQIVRAVATSHALVATDGEVRFSVTFALANEQSSPS